MGILGGANTSYFNKQILHTDDQVYFYALLGPPNYSSARYGDFGRAQFRLNESYASAHGWVSAYVMYPEDLAKFAKRAAPDHSLSRDSFWTVPSEIAEDQVSPAIRAETTVLQHLLHRCDFTVADWSFVLRNQLKIAMSELSSKDFPFFSNTMRILAGQNYDGNLENSIRAWDELQNLLDELVFRPLGLPKDFELKVPVAVPAEQLRVAAP